MTIRGVASLVAAVSLVMACGPSRLSEESIEAVTAELKDRSIWEAHDVELEDVQIVETTRLLDDDDDTLTWCLAVEAVTSDPDHFLDGSMIWLATKIEGEWQVTPTFMIAVMHLNNWEERCGMEGRGAS